MTKEDQILERLARIEERLDGVSRVEEQLQTFGRPWENLSDLGRDLSILMEPAVRKLSEELVEVEIGFQIEDFFVLLKRVLPSLKYLTWSLAQLENLVDWWEDMEPIMKLAAPKLIDFLDDLEQKGIFRINAAVLEMYTKVAAHYTPEDIEAIGDGFVLMHGIVKKLANPEVIQFLDKLLEIPMTARLKESQPVGPVGLLFKMRDEKCRKGLGVVLELTRALGELQEAPASAS